MRFSGGSGAKTPETIRECEDFGRIKAHLPETIRECEDFGRIKAHLPETIRECEDFGRIRGRCGQRKADGKASRRLRISPAGVGTDVAASIA